MDTSGKRRRRWTVEVKRQIVEESFAGDSSVAQLAKCNTKVESEIKKAPIARSLFVLRQFLRSAILPAAS